MILLSLSASAIDARRSFGGISTHEAEGESGYKGGRKGKGKKNERQEDVPLLVEEENIGPTLEKSVCGGEASKTTTNYDYLCHEDVD